MLQNINPLNKRIMKAVPFILITFSFLLCGLYTSAQYTDGATVSLILSTKFTAPGVTCFINGETQVGKEPVTVHVEIKSPKNKIEAIDVVTDKFGNYHAEHKFAEPYGKYFVTASGADGKRSVTAEIWVLDPDGMKEALEEEMAKLSTTAQQGLDAANKLVEQLPSSPAKTQYKEKADKVKEGLKQAEQKFKAAAKDFSVLVSFAAKYPPVFEKVQPYLEQIESIKNEAAENEKNFKERIKQSEREAATCDYMNFIGEAAGFISLVLDFQGKLAKKFINLASDKALPGALDRMQWGSTPQQEQDNAKFKLNTVQKGAVGTALGFEEFRDFAKTGFTLDFITYVAKSMYGTFCDELKGPFSGDFRAEFDASSSKGIWNSYDMAMKGNLVLRYEKGGDAKKGFAVSGEFEGVYTKYDFWEDFEKVEEIPAGMVLFMRDKIKAVPIDPSKVPVPNIQVSKDGKTAKVTKGELDINNDLGLIARQMLPGSFRIKVKGKVINDKVYLEIDKDAATNATNIGQTNQLIVGVLQPMLPIPIVRVFDFPMAPARSVFTVGMGEQQVFELITTGDKTRSIKKIENVKKLDGGNIRLRTRLDIKIGS